MVCKLKTEIVWIVEAPSGPNLFVHILYQYNMNKSFSPYSKANNTVTDWIINSIPQADATAFWQFLFVKHQAALAKHHFALEADDIPSGSLHKFHKVL
jgi:hypothetical protein